MERGQVSADLELMQKFLVVYRYMRRYSRDLHSTGVRGRELAALRYLDEQGPRTIGQLKSYLFVSHSTASELVSRMEEAGYVKRRRSARDSRVVLVELSEDGQRIARETPLGGLPLLRERLKTVPPDRLELMDQAFTYLIRLLEIDPDAFR
ncbi:MAG TPA: MarR family transcriptional regulator [Chloroflexi bacterium]|nr:MarR family transcriptional regulator [Chloroflexota bacterium]